MKTLYLFKAFGYIMIALLGSKNIEVVVGFSFLAVLMLFFWLDLCIRDYINELKNK